MSAAPTGGDIAGTTDTKTKPKLGRLAYLKRTMLLSYAFMITYMILAKYQFLHLPERIMPLIAMVSMSLMVIYWIKFSFRRARDIGTIWKFKPIIVTWAAMVMASINPYGILLVTAFFLLIPSPERRAKYYATIVHQSTQRRARAR